MLAYFGLKHLFCINEPSAEINYEDIIFDEPKSLLTILKEHHENSRAYILLKELVKPNDMPIMLFNSLRQFGYKDECEIKIEYFDKIYLSSWNLHPMYLDYVEYIASNKLQAKRDKNKKPYWLKIKKNDSWDNMSYSRSNKINDFKNIIEEGIEQYNFENIDNVE